MLNLNQRIYQIGKFKLYKIKNKIKKLEIWKNRYKFNKKI